MKDSMPFLEITKMHHFKLFKLQITVWHIYYSLSQEANSDFQ